MHRSIRLDDSTYKLLEEISSMEKRSTASLIRSLLATHPSVMGYQIFRDRGYDHLQNSNPAKVGK